jgi:transposase-like protein
MSNDTSRIEIITGRERRRRYSAEHKLQLVEETMQPGMTVSAVARLHGVSPSLLFKWRQLMSEVGRTAVRADEDVVGSSRVRELEARVRGPGATARPQDAGGRRAGNQLLERRSRPRRLCDRHLRQGDHRVARYHRGISGEMVRDLMLACVEQLFAATRAPHPVQWLADNGSLTPRGKHWKP